MITVRFLSFLARHAGKKFLEMEENELSVREILENVLLQLPQLKDFIDLADPEVTVIMDGRTLSLPSEYENIVRNELVISPIIAGGSSF